MVLEPKQTTVAYRCPHCGAGVMSAVGLFNLTADMVKLKCSCGESEMSVVYGKDGKVRFTVPCILCPTPHTFTVSSSLFFGKELFVLPCPYSDINICIGDTIVYTTVPNCLDHMSYLPIVEICKNDETILGFEEGKENLINFVKQIQYK
jgi:hypothetical protein